VCVLPASESVTDNTPIKVDGLVELFSAILDSLKLTEDAGFWENNDSPIKIKASVRNRVVNKTCILKNFIDDENKILLVILLFNTITNITYIFNILENKD
tara:strand:+ start:970 stop:1269 length:300 start_codon:yes stop_codon:yes gene_type:complete